MAEHHCSWDGQDLEQAAAQLDKVLHCEVSEEQAKQDWYMPRQGEGWFLLGEARRALKDAEGACVAYRESIKYPTTFAYRARYHLAMAEVAKGAVDDAKTILQQNLEYLRKESPPDAEAQEKTLFALGELSYTHGDYHTAVECLSKALTAGRFPADPEATHPLPAGRLLPPPRRPGQRGRPDGRRRRAMKRPSKSGRTITSIWATPPTNSRVWRNCWTRRRAKIC